MDKQKISEAKQQFIEWLSDPREFGEAPAKIEYVKTFVDEDGIECIIFKFKKTLFSKWLLGIVSDAGVFSEMQVYNEATAEKDAKECLKWLKNYWLGKASQEEGDGANEHADKAGHFMTFVLFSDKTWDKEQFRQDLRDDWRIVVNDRENEKNAASEDSQSCNTEIFQVDSARVVMAFLDVAIPNGEAEQNAAMNYMWKEAVEVTKTHQAHMIVTIMGAHENPVEDGKLIVKVITSLCRQKNVIGVNTNGVVYQPQFYLAMKEMLDEGMLPIYVLVWFGAVKTEHGFSVYTIGMNNFGKDDMEILDTDEDVNELRDFMIDMATYCIESDVVLRAGESIGVSEDHRCQISRSKGVFVDGTTLKIAYRRE